MARKAYNGWTKEQRTKSGREARKKYASGEWTRPVKCVVCWITVEQGALVHDHLEDYSDPESRFGVCYRCHMALHSRFFYSNSFKSYRNALSHGLVFEPLVNNWPQFCKEHKSDSLVISGDHLGFERGRTFLDLLELEEIDYVSQMAAGGKGPPHPRDLPDVVVLGEGIVSF